MGVYLENLAMENATVPRQRFDERHAACAYYSEANDNIMLRVVVAQEFVP